MNDNAATDGGPAEPAASDYIELACRLNRIATSVLRPDTRDADWLDGKISLGLSLQAAEVAGKGILRALGHSPDCIRKHHSRHDILSLLRGAEKELQAHENGPLSQFHHFLNRTLVIDGQKYGTTIGGCLKELFEKGETAKPRSYLYADFLEFAGTVPIQALAAVAGDLVAVAQRVAEAVEGSQRT